MFSGHDIVCFGNDWDGDPLSKKHIMTRLARHNRVLWVNSLGCRNPRASVRDLRRVVKKARDFLGGCRSVAPNVWVFSPMVVPFHGNRAARFVNRGLLRTTLRRACRKLGMDSPISWSFLPSSADVAGSLHERLVVYHCVDDNSQFTGTDAVAIDEMEGRLATRADVVFVSAAALQASRGRHNPRTHLVTHGVELEHFRAALDPATVVPADLPRGDGPLIGFFGLIADWVDLDLVRHLAVQRPRWRLCLIGNADTDLAPVRGLANVTILGPRPYRDLPGYCRGFDVAILPFRVNKLTLAANPLKLREYLAAGLPVVATALPEAERLAPLVRVGRDADDFLRLLDEVVGGGAVGPQAAISRAMDGESWDGKVEELSAIVAPLLRPRGQP